MAVIDAAASAGTHSLRLKDGFFKIYLPSKPQSERADSQVEKRRDI
jgi:hypothetical protein